MARAFFDSCFGLRQWVGVGILPSCGKSWGQNLRTLDSKSCCSVMGEGGGSGRPPGPHCQVLVQADPPCADPKAWNVEKEKRISP